jgi:hypothetical protein
MNFFGNFIILDKEDDVFQIHNDIKLWYLLYSKPKNSKEYHSAISMSNIYINETLLGMTYNLQYKNSIIDHMQINKD